MDNGPFETVFTCRSESRETEFNREEGREGGIERGAHVGRSVARPITLDLGAVVVVARGNNGHWRRVEWSGQVGTVRSVARSPGWFSPRRHGVLANRHVALFVRDKRSRPSQSPFAVSWIQFRGLDTFLFVLFGQNNILILIVCVRRGDYFV